MTSKRAYVRRKPQLDLTGQTFGLLTVTGFAGVDEKRGQRTWTVVCKCGNTGIRSTARLQNAYATAVQSCGCARYRFTPIRTSYLSAVRHQRIAALRRGYTVNLPRNQDNASSPGQLRRRSEAVQPLRAALHCAT